MRRLELYTFKYRDRITGKWVRARHKLQMPALQRQYAEWEITGVPEIRHVTPGRIKQYDPFKFPTSRSLLRGSVTAVVFAHWMRPF